MADNAYLVTETPSGTQIEILKHPDFPLGSFLLEILVLNLALFGLAIIIVRLLGSHMWCCSTFLVLFGVILAPFHLIWNYWSKHRLELTENLLTVNRIVLLGKWEDQRFRKEEVQSIHVIHADEKSALFEGVFGLRLLSLRNQGTIGFETPQGMMIRFGWGLSNSEAEEIVSIIQEWLNED